MPGLGWQETVVVVVTSAISIAFQVAIVVLGVALAWRWLRRSGALAADLCPPAMSALDILAERFARGEIEAEEFEARRARLLARPE